jgi:transcriptional regulator with XRE-family HTH domain
MTKATETRVLDETADVLTAIGRRIRRLRMERNLTLQVLGERTGLSNAMLSLLERGKTGPSIGTLVVIASALGAQMSDLLKVEDETDDEVVSRRANQYVYETGDGVTRRILKHDRVRGIEVAVNEYSPGTSNSPEPRGHEGFEYGVLLEGSLEEAVCGQTYRLEPGDLVAYDSTNPHRIANAGRARARALWINLKKS